jgi:hypothetical protein
VEQAPTPEGPTEPNSLDGWEPGLPSIRGLLPSIIGGGVVPLAVYYLVRHHVHSDADALIIAGTFPAAWIVIRFARQRRVDPIGAIVLFGFAVGVLVSTLLGGNAYVLKARDSAFTAVLGVSCLVSLFAAKRPVIFYIGRFLSAGTDPDRIEAYDQLHDLPGGEHAFRVLTIVWGIGLLIEASTRLVLAAFLSTGVFLGVSPVISAVCIGAMFAFTVWYSRQTQEAAAQALGQAEPPVPLD